MGNQTDKIIWREGNVPVSTRFDDPFFSEGNGAAETAHVFLGGNDLPHRFQDGFRIAELGFGTGLNLLVAWQAWIASGQVGVLSFTSFEAFPMAIADMERAHQAFEGLGALADALRRVWQPQGGLMTLPQLRLSVVVGDARETVPHWQGQADAWFLDGFSPAKNPELWTPELMGVVAEHTALGGTCATYSAAGFVRRGLQDAGFEVARVPGYGRKRHMTRGTIK